MLAEYAGTAIAIALPALCLHIRIQRFLTQLRAGGMDDETPLCWSCTRCQSLTAAADDFTPCHSYTDMPPGRDRTNLGELMFAPPICIWLVWLVTTMTCWMSEGDL